MKGFCFRMMLLAVALMMGAAVAQTWDVGASANPASVKATLSDGVLTISGTGRMMSKFRSEYPWSRARITSVIIEEGVTSIGENSFEGQTTLTSVTLPNSMKVIEYNAFDGCGLTSITIPNSVDSIGEYAFGCEKLTSISIGSGLRGNVKSLFGTNSGIFQRYGEIPRFLVSIDVDNGNTVWSSDSGVLLNKNKTQVLYCPRGKQGTYTIPNSVTYIEESAFSGCDKLTSITIPEGIREIGTSAFRNCKQLTSIIIPNSVTSVGESAFGNCDNLMSITIGENIRGLSGFDFAQDIQYGHYSKLTAINVAEGNNRYSSEDGVLFNKNKTELIRYPEAKQGKYTIPNGVTSIGEYAFYICNELTSITIPNSVKTISSFIGCTNLIKLIIGNGVTSIPRSAFTTCTALDTITIGGGTIGESAFYGLSKLKTIILGDSVKSIGKEAFKSCSTLTSVTVPNNVDSIGSNAFSGCAALSFAAIGGGKIGNNAFENLTNLTTLILGNNVKSIGDGTFNGCTKLTTLTVPDNVKTIGASAFSGCSRLQTASIGNGADSIGVNAFRNCAGLTSVIIGNKVKSIGASAFNGCTGLASLTSLASDPPVVGVASGNGTFDGIDKATCKLKVQQVDMGMYRNAAGWKDFANIEAVQFPNVPVLDITGVPASFKVGEVLALTGAVTPSTATNKTIEWSVAGASISGTNFTGAVIDGGNKLSAAAPGTVVVRAAIPSGAITGVDFERYFFITAKPSEDSAAVSVSSRDRVIPSAVTAGVSAVAPVSRLSAEFSVGPNPAGKSSGAVNFFHSGAAIKSAALYVYDVSGNIVKRISVSDKASVGVQSKRHVGSWDLKDKKGRTVSAGTYLVKGAVKTRDGKSEKVSAVVGVR